MEQPKFSSGERVMAMCDDGIYREAWIGEVVASYQYTIRYAPHGSYNGHIIPGVLKPESTIRRMEEAHRG